MTLSTSSIAIRSSFAPIYENSLSQERNEEISNHRISSEVSMPLDTIPLPVDALNVYAAFLNMPPNFLESFLNIRNENQSHHSIDEVNERAPLVGPDSIPLLESRSSKALERAQQKAIKNAAKLKLAIEKNVRLGFKSCPQCSKGFTRTSSLKRHYYTHLPEEQWPLKCCLCPKRFHQRFDLTQHKLTVHDKIRPFICGFPGCTKAYSTNFNLKVHTKKYHSIPNGDLVGEETHIFTPGASDYLNRKA